MFLEYVTDMSFVLISLIGSIIAILFVYVKKVNKRRVR
ncbi:EYxxD motif small membrane protein [Bacillus massilinigeriensis]